MPETVSTLDVVARRDEAGEFPQQPGTQFFLFPQGHGHLLADEPFKDESSPDRRCSGTLLPSPVGKETTPTELQGVRVLRARHLSVRHEERYILLKKYDGFVSSRGESSFTARLFESPADYPVLEAEFDLEELSESDRELAVEGTPMVWTIGYRYDGSTRKRESAIYLRRLPPWSEKEIQQGKQAAEELTRGLHWE